MKPYRIIGVVLFVGTWVMNLTALQADDSLLEQSFNLSQMLSGSERLFYLSELTHISTVMKPQPQDGQRWAFALLRVAKGEQNPALRIPGEKNALGRLSYFNPALALQLLPEVEIEATGPDGMLSEDLRADAAEEIFDNFIKGAPGNLNAIHETARYLGRTGQYPYRAMAGVVSDLPAALKSNASGILNETNTILNDALGFYAQETGFYNRDEEFLALLKELAAPSSLVDKELMSRALSVYVRKVTSSGFRLPGDYYSELRSTDGKIVVPFKDRNLAFIFQIFPAIKLFNHPLANEILQAHPEFEHATNGMHYFSGGFVKELPTSEETAQRHIKWIEESMLEDMKGLRDCDAEYTAGLPEHLTGTTARVVAYSWTVPAVARQSQVRAKQIYESQLAELNDVTDPTDTLRATVALARAAHSVDTPRFRALSLKAIEIGRKLFASGNDEIRADAREQLRDLVSFAAAQPDDLLQATVQQLPPDWLKAYLELYEAKGHASRGKQSVCQLSK
jgi:hypothetical protein